MNPITPQPTDQPPAPELNPTPETPQWSAPEAADTSFNTQAPAPEAAPAPDVLFPASPQPVAAPVEAPVEAAQFGAPAPVAPVAQEATPVNPFAPLGSGPAPVSAPEPKKSNTKKIVLIAGIAGGVILLAVVAVILYLTLMTVSKKDYRDAALQFNTVSTSNSSLTREIKQLSSVSSGDSESAFSDSVKTAKDSLASMKEKSEKLGSLKAVRSGEGKELYKTFNDKLVAYLAYGDEVIVSIEKIRPALVTCGDISSATDKDAQIAAIKKCSADLGTVGTVPNAEFQTFITALNDGYKKYIVTAEGMAALTNPYGAQYEQYKVLRDDMTATQKTITTASRDFSKAIAQRDDQASVKESADALGAYLTKQQK